MNKKILAVVGVLAVGGYLAYSQSQKNTTVGIGLAPRGRIITDNPIGAVYVLIDGKKYAFVSEQAFVAYGWSEPELFSASEIASIPDGGFVDNNGHVANSNGIRIG